MKTLLSLLLSAACAVTFADAIQPYDASTAYINLNTGISTLAALPTGEWTGNLNAGYNFNRGFALEGGYNLFTGSQLGATTSTNIFDIAAKGTLPLSEVFALYGRLGLGYGINSWSGTTNVSDCVLCNSNSYSSNYALGLAGIGGSFTLSKHFDLRIEDTLYVPFASTYTGNINAVTGGVQYNF